MTDYAPFRCTMPHFRCSQRVAVIPRKRVLGEDCIGYAECSRNCAEANYNDADPNIGISLNPSFLGVEVCNKADIQLGNEWQDIAPLVSDGEAETSAVLDFAD